MTKYEKSLPESRVYKRCIITKMLPHKHCPKPHYEIFTNKGFVYYAETMAEAKKIATEFAIHWQRPPYSEVR